jgi:hypothetical protein
MENKGQVITGIVRVPLCTALATLLAIFTVSHPTAAQYLWTEPAIIDTSSPNLLRQVGSSMTVDSSDNLLVVWDDRTGWVGAAWDTLLFLKSTDQGETWSRNVIQGGWISMEGEGRYARDMVVDRADNIWVLWSYYPNQWLNPTLNLSKSTDGGESFSTVFMDQQDSFDFIPQLSIGPDNSIYMIWDKAGLRLTRFRGGDTGNRVDTNVPVDTFLIDPFASVAVSDDFTVYAVWGGSTFFSSAGYKSLVFCSVSHDSGNSFLSATRVDTIEVMGNSQKEPRAALDSQGNLYVVYSKVPELNMTDVMMARSTDQGLSFSDALRVNDTSGNHTHPSISVDHTDGINVAWSGVKGIQFSRSTDGGATFSPSDLAGGGAWPNLAVSTEGIAYVVYDRLEVYFTKATVITGVDETPGLTETVRLYQNYPNPFNASTTLRFELDRPSRVVITIHDLLGRLVDTIMDEQRMAGSHVVHWTPGSLASGMYVATMRAWAGDNAGTGQSRRMIIVK